MTNKSLASLLGDGFLRKKAYKNGYNEALGNKPESSEISTDEILNTKYESDYIDGFMVGLGEK